MRITTLSAIAILFLGVAACNNPAPADTTTSVPAAEVTAPENAVMPVPETANAVVDPAAAAASNAVTEAPASNAVAPAAIEPKGLPDRREAPPAGEGATEPK
jgi:hypothetical protein